MTYGMKFVDEGKTLSDNDASDVIYTSENDTLQVDITQDPSHIGTINPLKKAAVFSITVANAFDYQYREETLFQIEHNLPFKPNFTCYFYLYDSPYPTEIGSYRLDYIRIGMGGEYIYADTDEKYFYIKHSAAVTGTPFFPQPPYPYTWTISGANERALRVKYMIHPMPDLGLLTYDAI